MSFHIRRSLCKSLVFAATASAALLALSPGAQAGDAVPQVKVSYSDLNLSNEADAKRLYQRLRVAADAACSAYNGRELYKVQLKRACTTAALDRAVLEVNQPTVSALHGTHEPMKVAQHADTHASEG